MAQNLKRNPGLYRLLILVVVILLTSASVFLILRNQRHPGSGGQTVPVQAGSPVQGADIFGTGGQTSPCPYG